MDREKKREKRNEELYQKLVLDIQHDTEQNLLLTPKVAKNAIRRYFNHYRFYLKDWRLYFKIFLAAIIAFGLIWFLVQGIVDIKTNNDDWKRTLADGTVYYDYGGYVADFFSYFTYQSNILLLVWLLVAIACPWHEGKRWMGAMTQLLVATYISITTIIFWCMLIPSNVSAWHDGTATPYNAITWVCSVLLHAVSGIGFTIYVCLFSTKFRTYNWLRWSWRYAWTTLIYPAVYCAAILIREECRIHSMANEDTIAPYFFFKIHEHVNGMMGWIWLIIAIVAIVIIAYVLSTLYAYAQDKTKEKTFMHIQKDLFNRELVTKKD